jgi:hypothetical protein
MKNFKKIIEVISIFVAFSILVGISFNTPSSDIPDWVKGKLPNNQDTIYAVGLANIGPNLVMARKKADDDARNELGKILSVKVKSVFEKFTKESIDLLNPENNSSTEISSEVTKSVTEVTISNVNIVDRYQDEENNIMYSLAMMSKSQVVSQIKDVVNQSSKKYFQEDKKPIALKKLDDELEKWDLTK